MPHKVSTIYPINKFSLCLQSFHWSSIPERNNDTENLGNKPGTELKLKISLCQDFNSVADLSCFYVDTNYITSKNKTEKSPLISEKQMPYKAGDGDVKSA